MPWDALDTDEGTQFPELRKLPVEVDPNQIELDFSLDVKKKEGEEEEGKAKAKKKQVIKVLPDAKRAYTMSIAIARIIKMGFPALKHAVEILDGDVLDADVCSTLLEYQPKPEEIAAVNAFVDSGGQITDCDTTEQFVYAMKDIPNYAPKLTAHRFALGFGKELDELIESVEKSKTASETLRACKKLPRFLFLVTRIGNVVNETNVGGIKLTTIPKLNEYKTTTKPVRNLLQYMVGIIHDSPARDDLDIMQELVPLIPGSKVDLTGVEQRIQSFQGQLKATTNQVEKLAPTDPIIDHTLVPFVKAANEQIQKLTKLLADAKAAFEDVAAFYGEDAESIKKLAPHSYLSLPLRLARELQAIVKDIEDKAAREAKRKAASAKKQPSKAPKAPTEKTADTSLRTNQDANPDVTIAEAPAATEATSAKDEALIAKLSA